jgi:hypothetical protein
LFTKMLSPA